MSNLVEIVIPKQLYSLYEDSFVWAKQHLDDTNHRYKKYVYDGCEIRPLFVLSVEGDKLIGLDVSSQSHWNNYEFAVKIEGGYVLCDKQKEVDIYFEFPKIDSKTKEFIKDKDGNIKVYKQGVVSANIQATEEQIKEIHEKYEKYRTQNSALKKDLNDFWNIRDNIKELSKIYDEVNLIDDGGKLRPLSKEELANKFAVSIEQSDNNDYKTPEELKKFADETGAEHIMFFIFNGQYGGEYSFLYSGDDSERIEDKVYDIAKKYKQKAYAWYDENGNYHEIKV